MCREPAVLIVVGVLLVALWTSPVLAATSKRDSERATPSPESTLLTRPIPVQFLDAFPHALTASLHRALRRFTSAMSEGVSVLTAKLLPVPATPAPAASPVPGVSHSAPERALQPAPSLPSPAPALREFTRVIREIPDPADTSSLRAAVTATDTELMRTQANFTLLRADLTDDIDTLKNEIEALKAASLIPQPVSPSLQTSSVAPLLPLHESPELSRIIQQTVVSQIPSFLDKNDYLRSRVIQVATPPGASLGNKEITASLESGAIAPTTITIGSMTLGGATLAAIETINSSPTITGTLTISGTGTSTLASSLQIASYLTSGGLLTVPSLAATSTTATSTVAGGLSITGGGLSLGTLTQGSIPFIGASGAVLQNNSNFYWDAANQRLGIGTTSPFSLLNIAGATPKLTLSDTGAGTNLKHWFLESSAGSLRIGTTSDALVTDASYRTINITTTGQVGIGRIPSIDTFSAPFTTKTALDVNGIIASGLPNDTNAIQGNAGGFYAALSNDSTSIDGGSTLLFLDNQSLVDQTGVNITFAGRITSFSGIAAPAARIGAVFTHSSNTLIKGDLVFLTTANALSVGPTEKMRITNTGNVGIGTTSPSAKFAFTGDGTGATRAFVIADSANTERVSILNNGNVGIGTTSPVQLLSIAGHCVTGDTRLRRRRRKNKNVNGEWEYDYDEVLIKEIQQGDEIASLDEKTGRIVWSKVNALMDMGVKPIYKLTTASGKTIRTTAEHPYLVRQAVIDTDILYDTFFELIEAAAKKFYFTVLAKQIIHAPALDNAAVNISRQGWEHLGVDRPKRSKLNLISRYFALPKIISILTALEVDVTYRQQGETEFWAFHGAVDGASVKVIVRSIGGAAKHFYSVVWQGEYKNRITNDPDENEPEMGGVVSRLYPRRRGIATPQLRSQYIAFARELSSAIPHTLARALEKRFAAADRARFDPAEGVWQKVSGIAEGQDIAISGNDGRSAVWDRITSIEHLPAEQVYDIEVEGTHNFIGNDIVAHNTYITGGLGVGQAETTNGNITGTGRLSITSTTATSTFSTGGLTVGTSQFVVQQTSGNVGIGTTGPG
ncbi:MAG: hypothetical protein Q8R13_04590, partial [bacterium]|nr:hypothetical protein [bacterium]